MGPQARLVDDGDRPVTALLLAAALLTAIAYTALRRPRRPTYADLVIVIQCDTQALAEALGMSMLPCVERTIAELEDVLT